MMGFADIHVHMFAHLGFGGGVMGGASYDPKGGVNAALRPDYATDVPMENVFPVVALAAGAWPAKSTFAVCPTYLGNCGKFLLHGDHMFLDSPMFGGLGDGANGHMGAPAFSAWPRWTSVMHQQVYYRWLERAWRGGMRLMTMLAVNNEVVCKASRRRVGEKCDDSMTAIDKQLDAAFDFQTFLDRESGGHGRGWFRIVTSYAAAREVIRAGKLAVVLGIEVDNLFNCKEHGSCTPARVQAKVDEYYKRGVRHIFPIHNFDNGFGGAATWQDAINVGNAISEGRYWEVEDCHKEGYGFWLDSAFERLAIEGLGIESRPKEPPLNYTSGKIQKYASCNRHGLSALGKTLIESLMDHGMIIDIDHMSRRSLADTLQLVKKRRYPIVAGHVQFFDRHRQTFGDNVGRHERMRTADHLDAIRASGGLVAVMTKDDQQDGGAAKGEKPLSFGAISNNCANSTKTFAQAYLFAISEMKGPVAFGSDFNGFAGHVGPRFGSEACGGSGAERSAQARAKTRLKYPFVLDGFGTFEEQVSGQKTFDFNVDGLAHVGLYPDMIADLKRIGVTDKQLEPLFRSAEAYVEMWERAASRSQP